MMNYPAIESYVISLIRKINYFLLSRMCTLNTYVAFPIIWKQNNTLKDNCLSTMWDSSHELELVHYGNASSQDYFSLFIEKLRAFQLTSWYWTQSTHEVEFATECSRCQTWHVDILSWFRTEHCSDGRLFKHANMATVGHTQLGK